MSGPTAPPWPPRDWRMLVALILLGVAGGGAWVLNWRLIGELATLSQATRSVWPLAYQAYGAMIVLAITSLGFAMVVALKAFRLELPGGGSVSASSSDEGCEPPRIVTTTQTEIVPAAPTVRPTEENTL